MEPEVREFLKRIMMCISVGFSWMMINIIAGIKYNLAFIEEHFTLGNGLFYLWFVISFIFLFRFFRKLWQKPF